MNSGEKLSSFLDRAFRFLKAKSGRCIDWDRGLCATFERAFVSSPACGTKVLKTLLPHALSIIHNERLKLSGAHPRPECRGGGWSAPEPRPQPPGYPQPQVPALTPLRTVRTANVALRTAATQIRAAPLHDPFATPSDGTDDDREGECGGEHPEEAGGRGPDGGGHDAARGEGGGGQRPPAAGARAAAVDVVAAAADAPAAPGGAGAAPPAPLPPLGRPPLPQAPPPRRPPAPQGRRRPLLRPRPLRRQRHQQRPRQGPLPRLQGRGQRQKVIIKTKKSRLSFKCVTKNSLKSGLNFE